MPRPPYVILRLTEPRMGSAERPSGAQEAELIRRVQGKLAGLEADGIYGCATARAVQSWQWRAGAPRALGAITPDELAILLGDLKRPAPWRERTASPLLRPGVFRAVPDPIRCADAPPSTIKLIPREAVGLRAPRGRSVTRYAAGTPVVLHYQGPGRGAVGLEAAFRQLRGFQDYHMDHHGWSDIGYNLAVPRGVEPGVVIELRGLGIRGAHSGHNLANGYPGILVMFGEDDDGPDAGQLLTLAALRAAITHGRRTGHVEWFPTACPGRPLQAWITGNR